MWDNIRVTDTKCSDLNVYSGDLRISITSQCDMQCVYCHSEGKSTERCLSLDEVLYIIANSIDFGIKSVRITGGEPTMHPDLVPICSKIKQCFPQLHLGINTNGINSEKILDIAKYKLVDRIVFGIDRFDAIVSKNSPIGKSSKQILDTILMTINAGCRAEIDAVYDGNYDNIYRICEWGMHNRIRVKVLEEINDEISDAPAQLFRNMIPRLIADFDLLAGVDIAFDDLYGFDKDGTTRISFFHSLCRTRECSKCARMHMRVTSEGKTKPCLRNNETEFDLLHGDFRLNFLKGICYLGVPPLNK